MRKHFFRPFIADPVCASPDPGHHVDVGRYFMAVVKSSVTIPVRAEVRDGSVGLEWAPEWRVLLVPRASLADERTVFTLAYPDERTECATELSLAGPRWIRRN